MSFASPAVCRHRRAQLKRQTRSLIGDGEPIVSVPTRRATGTVGRRPWRRLRDPFGAPHGYRVTVGRATHRASVGIA